MPPSTRSIRAVSWPAPDIDEEVDPTEWNNYVRKSQDSLRVIAEQTGGFAIVNQNDFDKALKRIDAETSDYYVLGYYSSNPDRRSGAADRGQGVPPESRHLVEEVVFPEAAARAEGRPNRRSQRVASRRRARGWHASCGCHRSRVASSIASFR